MSSSAQYVRFAQIITFFSRLYACNFLQLHLPCFNFKCIVPADQLYGACIYRLLCAQQMLKMVCVAGAFIFVGGYELIATEFTNERNLGKSKYRRAGLFLPIFAGFVLVALLQLVPGS